MKLQGQWWSRKRGSGLVGSEVGSKGQREVKNYLKDRLERKPEVACGLREVYLFAVPLITWPIWAYFQLPILFSS